MKTIASLLLLTGITQGMNAVESLPSPTVATLAPLPDVYGFAGMFAGVSDRALLCAGGANFPEKPLAEGGRKVWHDQVFVFAASENRWKKAGHLPQANGYGVSATWRDAVIVAGGGNARENFSKACLMRWDGAHLSFEALPDLPAATANGCGAVVGDVFYIAGGQESPAATGTLRRCFALDLAQPVRTWREIPWPEQASGRILAVAASHEGWFYLFSGTDLYSNPRGQPERRYLNDAWRYRPDAGWQRLADLPRSVAAAPSPAMNAGVSHLVIAGGVSPEFLASLPKDAPHPGFSRELLAYDIAANKWNSTIAPRGDAPARVTAPLTLWGNHFVIPSGEVAPGIRTPTVLTFSFAP